MRSQVLVMRSLSIRENDALETVSGFDEAHEYGGR